MPGIVTLDAAVLGPYNKLNGDATLISASYLNGANKIFKGPHRRDGVANPTLHILSRGAGITGDQKQVYSFRLQLNLYLPSDVDYNINMQRASLIQNRIAELIDGQPLTGATGVTYLNCYSDGNDAPLPVDLSTSAKRENLFVFIYYLEAGRQ